MKKLIYLLLGFALLNGSPVLADSPNDADKPVVSTEKVTNGAPQGADEDC